MVFHWHMNMLARKIPIFRMSALLPTRLSFQTRARLPKAILLQFAFPEAAGPDAPCVLASVP